MEEVREIVRFGPNGSYTVPAVTIKQQVDAVIRPGRYSRVPRVPCSPDASLSVPDAHPI